jgi:hypothetical protein
VKTILLSLLIIIGFISCSRTVEIPKNRIGIVYDVKTGDVIDSVFKSGKHSIGMSYDVVLFDVKEQKLNFSFDLLFKDATSGVIEFSIQYKVKEENLPIVCKKYRAALEMPLEQNVLLVTVRSQIRKQFQEVDKSGLTNDIIFDMIKKTLNTQESITEIIEIESFTPGQVVGL